jgi:hypothetical protein
MSNYHRRLKTIEVNLTPKQTVILWLKKSQKAGGFNDGLRQSPPSRGYIANAVYDAITRSMKGYPNPVIEKAIQQARQEADLLFMLIVEVNVRILMNVGINKICLPLVIRHFRAATTQGTINAESLRELRLSLVQIVEDLLVAEASALQVTAEYLNGQEVLFSDTFASFSKQLQFARELIDSFNSLAKTAGVALIDLDTLRESIPSQVDQQVASWRNTARLAMLVAFGEGDSWRLAMGQTLSASQQVTT